MSQSRPSNPTSDTKPNRPKAHPARRAALSLLWAVMEDQRLLTEALGDPHMQALAPGDRARAQRLATEVLRTADRADRLLKPLLRKEPPLAVKNVMRLGVVEICAFEEAAHGVVNDMVALAASSQRMQSYKGVVNAVLRRAGDAGLGKWGKLPVPRLSKWLRPPMLDAYGNAILSKIEVAHLKGAPLDLTPKSDADAVASVTGGTVLPTGSVRLTNPGQVSALPGFEAGDWWVQDAAAAIPARVLAAQQGERVADLCAAPGGKTLQLAAAGADVHAFDISEGRLQRVRENLDRTGLSATLTEANVLSLEAEPFDAVLLDAPCSATGTIRRHPDLIYAKDGSGISELIALQAKMIDRAVAMVKPGGRLVFCTCSLIPDEGEVQVDEALERHPDLSVDRDALKLPGIEPEWITEEGGLRLRPDLWSDRGGMDGFYIACLTRAG